MSFRFIKNKTFVFSVLSLFVFILGVYLPIDYTGPKHIELTADSAFGMSCMRAKELIVQEYDEHGNLWATRGMIIYRLDSNDTKFNRVAHIPTGINIFWLRNFSILRKLTVRPECVEMVTAGNGDICALSAGKLWHLAYGTKKFTQVYKLDHYGMGDQGVRNVGIQRINDSVLFFGEYFQNPDKTDVNILESKDFGQTWNPIYKFEPGSIRHIHALQNDTYTGLNWICTGDANKECTVGWSDDYYRTMSLIGSGDQMWRVCQLVFTEDYVYWGTDNGQKDVAGIYKWNRHTRETKKLGEIDGAVFFGTMLSNGTIVFSTDREGFNSEIDDKTRFHVLDSLDNIKIIEAGTWHHKKEGFRFKFAMLRFQRDQSAPNLVITCLNQKELPDGELLIIPEDEIIRASNCTAGPAPLSLSSN